MMFSKTGRPLRDHHSPSTGVMLKPPRIGILPAENCSACRAPSSPVRGENLPLALIGGSPRPRQLR